MLLGMVLLRAGAMERALVKSFKRKPATNLRCDHNHLYMKSKVGSAKFKQEIIDIIYLQHSKDAKICKLNPEPQDVDSFRSKIVQYCGVTNGFKTDPIFPRTLLNTMITVHNHDKNFFGI